MITEEVVTKNLTKQPKSEFDTPWKDILNLYFEQFMAYCLPKRHAEIDWSRGYRSLDKELHKIARNAPAGDRIADKLFEFYLKSGEETYILLHLEVQGKSKPSFEERMFISRYRIRDRYKKPIASLAILIDKNKNWRPGIYREELWDSSIELKFPIIKILDYKEEKPLLEASKNPFAAVILAQLAVMEDQSHETKLISKVALIRWLYNRGWKREDVLNLLVFIDWVFALPPELELECTKEIEMLEEEQHMQYITSWERRGIEKGLEQGLEQGIEQGIEQGLQMGVSKILLSQLEQKFINVPEIYRQKIALANDETLMKWAMRVIICNTIEDIFNI